MHTLHLFAGAGGGLLADLILGHTPIAAVEQDRYCCQILRERAAEGWFPGLHVHEADVRLFDPSEYAGRVDCIAAGFPCQDISHAGNRAGIAEGTRSGLWSEVVRVARIVRPRYLFLENVAAIVNLGLDTVLADLAAMGFDAWWVCLRASDAGARHLRDRLFLLADANSGRRESERESEHAEQQSECRDKPNGRGSNGRRNRAPGEWWAIESDLGRMVDGVASRVDRLKALGNGQVPLQAALAWRILIA